MKKTKKLFSKILLPISLIGFSSATLILASSCEKGRLDHKEIKLNSSYSYKVGAETKFLEAKDYSKVGKLFETEFIVDKVDPITFVPYTEVTNYWDYFSAAEGTVTSISDGDTLSVKILKEPKNKSLKSNQIIKVRLPLIDTLEEHTPNANVDPEEKALALIDHEFVSKQLLPVGSPVRLVTNNWADHTYDRHVAEIFFGDNFEKCYSVELVAAGYTLARLGNEQTAAFITYYKKEFKEKWEALVLPYLAYSINDAIENKRGFYDAKTFEKEQYKSNKEIYDHLIQGPFKNPYEFSKMYKSHGEMIGLSEYILASKYSQIKKTAKNSIFKFIQANNK